MEAPEDSLSMRRSKRSTAGNRMEEALLQFASEEAQTPELDDDVDFVGPDDEDEVFDSDFQSTDDEAQQEDETTIEKNVVEEEKREQRQVRQRAAKITTAAISRLEKKEEKRKAPSKKLGRRVSLGGAIDVETGKAVESRANRKSRRKSTILATQSLHSRLKASEVKRAAMPKRVEKVTQMLSQAELIQRALDTEEGNIAEHRDYLMIEEEKRRRARVVRKTISGPVIRWTSRVEQEKAPPPPSPPATIWPSSYSGWASTPGAGSSSNFMTPASFETAYSYSLPSPVVQTPIAPEQTRTVAKNYVVIEKDQKEGVSKPNWDDTMTTLFGDHVKWDEVKVFSSQRHRPTSRPIAICPLTGSRARYRDPRSGVPFSNVRAYRTLTRLMNHEYVWHDGLGCYTSDETTIEEASSRT